MLRPHAQVLYRRLDDEIVLVHLGTNQIYSLNETAARFWELLGDGGERTAVEAALAVEYEVDPRTLAAELDGLVDELEAAGLLVAER